MENATLMKCCDKALARIIHELGKWDRHLACLSWSTGWKPIPRIHA